MEGIGGKMVETVNLLVLLGFRGGWSVASPEWKKILETHHGGSGSN